ncbi:hypothetical protein [Magnetospirillum sulfuroxidans]|uniref:Uncharacterized protein n=1 Tax=Magnetospirillum sulfuroxidans TaxID=611300 RepID=A0ABS5ID45_9PROT|nr:hypothetical protein [Magnetospirillum sulfuroxidans]MBR9972347.1 hypothetical protein [Magnetospirillum sulfuroxidans]
MHKTSPNKVPAEAAVAVAASPGRTKTGDRCRANWEPALRSFLTVLERASSNGSISMDQVQRLAAAFLKAEGPMAELFARSENSCRDGFAEADLERKRQDHFGRLIARPFAPMFLQGNHGLERRHLPQFFIAVKMILGDEAYADMRSRAKLIAETHRGEGGAITWESFHADRRAILILDRVRLYVAKSFSRFEARKDWFLLVMNQAHNSVSLASNAFVAKAPEDRSLPQFTELHMLRLFEALFEDCDPKTLNAERKAGLAQAGGNDAEERIRQFRHNVRMSMLRLGGPANS